MESSMEQMAMDAMSAMNGDPRGMRVSTEGNPRDPVKNMANTGTPAQNTPAQQKKPEPQVIPPPAPTPPSRLITGLPVGRFVSVDDRKEPRRVVEKLSLAIFQATPEAALLEKFEKVAASKPVPFNDHAICELATLMMATPNYQLC
jgi:hypothetical protein